MPLRSWVGDEPVSVRLGGSPRTTIQYRTSSSYQGAIEVPVGQQWDIVSIHCRLKESAIVGARRIQLSLIDQWGNLLYITLSAATPVTSSNGTIHLTLFPGGDGTDIAATTIYSIRSFLPRLYDSYGIYYSIVGIQAGDNVEIVVCYSEVQRGD